MKKLALVLCLGLAGCAGSGSGSTPISSGDILAKAKQVQAYAVTACKFEPYISSVIALFNAGIGATVGAVGDAICQAATSVPLADGGGRVIKVNGITVKGRKLK